MSPSAVSIIAGASDAIPDPYSADSIASSNRNTSARRARGNRRRGKGRVGFRRRKTLGDDVSHVGDQADQGRSNRPKGVHRSSRREHFAGLSQLTLGRAPGVPSSLPDQISRFAAMCRDEGDQAPHAAPHARRDPGKHDDVHSLIIQFGRIGDVLKDPLGPRLDLVCPGTGERPDKFPRAQATGCRNVERNRFRS